jgi:hypothetical protein
VVQQVSSQANAADYLRVGDYSICDAIYTEPVHKLQFYAIHDTDCESPDAAQKWLYRVYADIESNFRVKGIDIACLACRFCL